MSLARVLATAGKSPFKMGPATLAMTGATSNGLMWVTSSNPAPRAGLVTSTTVIVSSSGGTYYVYTGSLVGSTFTVRAMSPQLSGVNTSTASVSLSVQAGDYIGFWSDSGGASIRENLPQTSTVWLRGQFSVPVVGNSYAMSSSTDELAIQAIGS